MQALLDTKTYDYSLPVTIEVDPARFGVKLNGVTDSTLAAGVHQKLVNNLVARGMRAQLQTGSLITGSRFVALDFFPNAAPVSIDWSQTPVQMPSVQDDFEALKGNLASIARKIDQLPFKEIGDNLNQTMLGARGTLTNADQLLANANKMIAPDSELDTQLGDLIQKLGGAAQAINLLADYLERHPEALIQGKSKGTK